MNKVKKSAKKKKSSLSISSTPHHYFNRELSWLEFNARVLAQAEFSDIPILEKFRFLAIYFSNLDEFVMKRVGGLERYRGLDYRFQSIDGLNLDQQLTKIREKILEDNKRAEKIYEGLIQELKKHEIQVVGWGELSSSEQKFCQSYFMDNFYPVLTPLSVDPGHPFPFISNLAYSFGIYLENPNNAEDEIFSRVKVPSLAHRFIGLPRTDNTIRLINGEEIIKQFLSTLYPGLVIKSIMPFRLTRNADWDHDDEDTEDLLEAIEESIHYRRLQEPIRLEVPTDHDESMLHYLLEETEIQAENIYYFNGLINYQCLHSLADLVIPHLRYKEWKPITPISFFKGAIFERIKEKDRLVHHPYESFVSSVERFIKSASTDPNVLSIKITLYRTGENSQIVDALIDAAKDGKQVVCLIELKARFDEKTNIFWARKLEQAGVHVVYGVVGLKTHSKISLVVRKETNGKLLRYAHIGTGNYNAKTAKLYTDLGLMTSDEKITSEIAEVFNHLTGTSLKKDYKHLLVSPINAKDDFIEKIKILTKAAINGKKPRIIAKMNSLEDIQIIDALYEASQAGVIIDLIVRGFCCLKPEVKGLSENITVTSIIGRFLEHSRIFFFDENYNEAETLEKAEVYIGSADWMHRNLHARVEVITPIYALENKTRLHELLLTQIKQNMGGWELKHNGQYNKMKGDKPHAQEQLMKITTDHNKSVIDL